MSILLAWQAVGVPRLLPFSALRYQRVPDLTALVAPPYDVISAQGRLDLEQRHPANAVRLDFPRDEGEGDPYERAAVRLAGWLGGGVLEQDATATLSIYRMTATDNAGRVTITTGILGALVLEEPGTGDILPHEQTTTKDKADRLSLIRATRLNTSPIWGLSMAEGVNHSYQPQGDPHHRATDEEGVVHELWIIQDAERINTICAQIASAPIVVADGHHRFETALTYQHERPTDDAGAAAILTYIVELAPDQLEVRGIHRIVNSLNIGLIEALTPFFDLRTADRADFTPAHAHELPAMGSLMVLTASDAFYATPKQGAFPAELTLDSERVRHALEVHEPSLTYHHDAATLAQAVADGAPGAILLRPATVAQIRHVAETRTRMPAKTTFFWPKPRSGMVFRPLDV
jgi:uncharacterized protein (DUF1015 family)